MNSRLLHLIDAVWEHDLPLGPEGDLEYRERAERDWERSLSVDDCLALLAWIEAPELPLKWANYGERWLPSLMDSAARHAGRAGSRLGDLRVVERLLELLSMTRYRHCALEGLIEFGDPLAFEGLLNCLGDSENRMHVCIAIAACASTAQVDQLRAMHEDRTLALALRNQIGEVIEECEAVDREGGRRTNRCTCRGGITVCQSLTSHQPPRR